MTPYNGFRLLRHAASAVVDYERTVAPIYAAAGKPVPKFGPDVLDHDGWYCRAVKPCPACQRPGGGEELGFRKVPGSESHATIH